MSSIFGKPLEYVYYLRDDVTTVQLLALEEYMNKPILAVANLLRREDGVRGDQITERLPNIPEREVIIALAALCLMEYSYALPGY